MKKNLKLRRALFACMMAFVFAASGIGASAILNNRTAVAEAPALTEPAADTSPAIYVAEKNAKSVVGIITNTQSWTQQGGVQDTMVAQGSGVVIREGGYVLTNNHVIEDGTAYQVLLPSGDKVDATLVGADSSTDLAVLKVNERADELVPVTVGSVDDLKVGSTVVAIGNPGGEVLANTVTQGIVSALERKSVNANNTTRAISYIQHDAAINSGNSGGGLFNYKGELVGINTLKYSGSVYSSVSFEGLGFAIPVGTVTNIANDLIENGKVLRPGLGVTVSNCSGPEEPLNNNPPESICVNSVNQGGAAEKAGIRQYDFIYAVDGERVHNLMELTSILDSHEAGDTIEVTLVRYNSVGYQQQTNPYSMFGGYGFGFGYGNGGNGGYGNDYDNSNGYGNGTLVAGNGFEYVTANVTLEILD